MTEIPMTETRPEKVMPKGLGHSNFEFRICFGFRYSDFRIYAGISDLIYSYLIREMEET